MKFFLAIVLFLSALMTSVHAQSDADDRYIAIYTLIQQGDTFVDNGQPRQALPVYQDALVRLQKFKTINPNWGPEIVSFRLDDLSEKIAKLQAKAPVKKNEPASAVVPADNLAKTDPQVENLRSQLQSMQDENTRLQAKLKEALATQPAMVDAGALATAQAQIRSLMKENDLLKAGKNAPGNISADQEITQLRAQLADSVKKLADEHARAENLVGENTALKRDLAGAGGLDMASLELLRAENDRLKLQLTTLQTAGKNIGATDGFSAKLAAAQAQIIALQSAASLALLEKTALENRVKHLTEERDGLRQQLAAAQKKNPGTSTADAAQIAALTEEVKTLRARVEADEARPVPFSEEELALTRQATNTPPVRPPVNQLPAGTAELVASASAHFSRHEYDAAEADYQKILQRDENNGLTLANLAAIEMQENKLDAAEKHIRAALAQSPDDAFNLAMLGKIKFSQDKYDEALDALSRAAKIDPSNPETQNYLGVTLSHKGLRVPAETALRKAIELDPNYAPAHNNIAVIYLSQTPPLPQLARWHYEKALAAGQPHNADLEKMLADKGAPVTQ